jgi:hypothetical protein
MSEEENDLKSEEIIREEKPNQLESQCDLSLEQGKSLENQEERKSKTPKYDFYEEHGYSRADHYR